MVELDNYFFDNNSWSFTKHRIWNRCQRQYYYEYIAPYLKSPVIVDINKIRLLKEYDSRFVLQGQIIHDILNEQIKLHSDKKSMDISGAMSFYSKKIAQNRMMADELFTEYRNGEKVDRHFFTTIEENGKECLNVFFKKIWQDYENRESLRHEEFDKFKIGDINVVVKVDFVSKMQDGTIVLTDWKTGADLDSYETELQMAAYFLWAMQYYQKSLNKIKSEIVFLRTGETKSYPFIEEQLREIQRIIKMDFEAMNASYEYEHFPPRPIVRECLSCRFARICPDAKMK